MYTLTQLIIMAQRAGSKNNNNNGGLRKSQNDLFESNNENRFRSMYTQAFSDNKKPNSGAIGGSMSVAVMSPMAKNFLLNS